MLSPLALSPSLTCGMGARSSMDGGVVGVGFMVNPQRGRDMRRRNPFSAAHRHQEDSMPIVITAVISFFAGVVALIYFLRYYAHFDFHPIDKDHNK